MSIVACDLAHVPEAPAVCDVVDPRIAWVGLSQLAVGAVQSKGVEIGLRSDTQLLGKGAAERALARAGRRPQVLHAKGPVSNLRAVGVQPWTALSKASKPSKLAVCTSD